MFGPAKRDDARPSGGGPTGGPHGLALARLTVALQGETGCRPSEAVGAARRAYAELRDAAGGGVPSDDAVQAAVAAAAFDRMRQRVDAADAAGGKGGLTATPASPASLPPSAGAASATEQAAAPPTALPGAAGGASGRRAALQPTDAAVAALMSIPPGSSYVTTLPPKAVARQRRAAGSANPGCGDVWVQLSAAKAAASARDERSDAAAAREGKAAYLAALDEQVSGGGRGLVRQMLRRRGASFAHYP
jgi:hypothetical protein